jgi:hypothetical protein
VTRFSFGVFGVLLRAAVLSSAALVAGCGSGAVGAPPTTVTPDPITITPNTATLYSDTPTQFIVTGGNGNYIIVSSDQSALPVAGNFTGGNVLTLIPNPVAADTPVTLTIRDTGTSTPITAQLTVKPRTVSNTVAIVPSTNECSTAVCSGSDAEVSIRIAQNGIPLANRTVRFDVVSGNFAVITSPAGLPETTALSGTTTTDASGFARIRIRVAPDAPSQTALLQITDVGSGSTQRASFFIAQNTGTSAGFFVTPTSVGFQGPNAQQCSNGSSADIYVFGGVPPYSILNSFPDFLSLSTTLVASSGGRFTVTTRGGCLENGTITIRDAAGRTASIAVTNALGTASVPALAVSPTEATLTDCDSFVNVNVLGGSGQYTATSGNPAVMATYGGSIVRVQRAPNTSFLGDVPVGVSDGRTTVTLTVHVDGPSPTGTCGP